MNEAVKFATDNFPTLQGFRDLFATFLNESMVSRARYPSWGIRVLDSIPYENMVSMDSIVASGPPPLTYDSGIYHAPWIVQPFQDVILAEDQAFFASVRNVVDAGDRALISSTQGQVASPLSENILRGVGDLPVRRTPTRTQAAEPPSEERYRELYAEIESIWDLEAPTDLPIFGRNPILDRPTMPAPRDIACRIIALNTDYQTTERPVPDEITKDSVANFAGGHLLCFKIFKKQIPEDAFAEFRVVSVDPHRGYIVTRLEGPSLHESIRVGHRVVISGVDHGMIINVSITTPSRTIYDQPGFSASLPGHSVVEITARRGIDAH